MAVPVCQVCLGLGDADFPLSDPRALLSLILLEEAVEIEPYRAESLGRIAEGISCLDSRVNPASCARKRYGLRKGVNFQRLRQEHVDWLGDFFHMPSRVALGGQKPAVAADQKRGNGDG